MKMKTISLVLIVFFIGTLIYNFVSYHYDFGILSEKNLPQIIGICAGVCGLLLSIIVFRFYQAKENLGEKD